MKRHWFWQVLLLIVSVPLIVYTIYGTEGVHLPLLVAMIASLLLGALNPEKGWFWAIVQAGLVMFGVLFVTNWLLGTNRIHPEVELQSLYGSVGLTFVGGFLGAYLKRAIDS